MSFDVKREIMTRLQGDGALVALLATDPNDAVEGEGHPQAAIFPVHASEAPQVYPCVTFRANACQPQREFIKPPILANVSLPTVEMERYDFEIWDQLNDGGDLRDQVRKRLDAVLHQQTFATAGEAVVFASQRVTMTMDDFDPVNHARFSLVSYVLRVQYPAA